MIEKVLPNGSLRRRLLVKFLLVLGVKKIKNERVEYYSYLTRLTGSQIKHYETSKKDGVLLSIVVPAYNTPKKYLEPLIKTIIGQTYSNWEMVIVNASTKPSPQEYVNSMSERDDRITVITVKNEGIARNTNEGIKKAKGEYIVFVDHDDLLEYDALLEISKVIADKPKAGIIYSDEDKVSDSGDYFFGPHIKPDWSPDLMTSVNFITHVTVIKKSLIRQVGFLDESKDGAQDYDLLLKIIDTGAEIEHIPKILYHWREAENSTAKNMNNKPEASSAGVKALEAHFDRIGVNATVKNRKNRPGFYKVKYEPIKKINIIVAPFASAEVTRSYLERLITRTDTTVTKVSIIVPYKMKFDLSITEYLDNIKIITIEEFDDEVDYLNRALKNSEDYVLIINKLVMPTNSKWLEELGGVIGLKRVLAVSPVIINDTNCIYDCGLVREDGILTRLFRGVPFIDNPTYFGNTEWCRNVDALTGNFTVLKKQEIMEFSKGTNQKTIKGLVRNFCLTHRGVNKDISIWSNTVMNDLTVAPVPKNKSEYSPYFNTSLERFGTGFHINVDDQTVLNRLDRLLVEDKTFE
jgi:glycosyltransferase involved in cell wall biosynthesis